MQNNTSPIKLIIELLILFIVCPITLGLPIHISIKLTCLLAAIVYCVVVSKQNGWLRFNMRGRSFLDVFHKAYCHIWFRFSAFAVLSTIAMFFYKPDALFYVVLNRPVLWLTMSTVYLLVSVIPQELLYRAFFFHRYQELFGKNQNIMLLCNAGCFCVAHFFFHNNLVYLLTFLGGILFYSTYVQHRSIKLVIAEHAAYGVWLFTLGLGDMLAFPGGPPTS